MSVLQQVSRPCLEPPLGCTVSLEEAQAVKGHLFGDCLLKGVFTEDDWSGQ